ncbi:hypothetical protein B0H21DRAFT_112017 [Amylocystis lapponica]|nr:hypothetical protein B0H21DRAFT_112017 [Amylocystis lapponica]
MEDDSYSGLRAVAQTSGSTSGNVDYIYMEHRDWERSQLVGGNADAAQRPSPTMPEIDPSSSYSYTPIGVPQAVSMQAPPLTASMPGRGTRRADLTAYNLSSASLPPPPRADAIQYSNASANSSTPRTSDILVDDAPSHGVAHIVPGCSIHPPDRPLAHTSFSSSDPSTSQITSSTNRWRADHAPSVAGPSNARPAPYPLPQARRRPFPTVTEQPAPLPNPTPTFPCSWGADCSVVLDDISAGGITRHLRAVHFPGSEWNNKKRGRCKWHSETHRCTHTSDMDYASFGKHVAAVHLGALRMRCEFCDGTFARQDSLKRHQGTCRARPN